MADAFIELEAQDRAKELSHAEWLGLLVDREVTNRDSKRFRTRLKAARLRHGQAAIEDERHEHDLGLVGKRATGSGAVADEDRFFGLARLAAIAFEAVGRAPFADLGGRAALGAARLGCEAVLDLCDRIGGDRLGSRCGGVAVPGRCPGDRPLQLGRKPLTLHRRKRRDAGQQPLEFLVAHDTPPRIIPRKTLLQHQGRSALNSFLDSHRGSRPKSLSGSCDDKFRTAIPFRQPEIHGVQL